MYELDSANQLYDELSSSRALASLQCLLPAIPPQTAFLGICGKDPSSRGDDETGTPAVRLHRSCRAQGDCPKLIESNH